MFAGKGLGRLQFNNDTIFYKKVSIIFTNYFVGKVNKNPGLLLYF